MSSSRILTALLLLFVAGFLSQGCYTPEPERPRDPDRRWLPAESRVDFTDPLLNRRQVFLFGSIDRRMAEMTIQKLLFLDGKGHEPIDLYLQTPGGEMQSSMAIEQTMRLLKSPVNTWALSECNSGGALLLAAGTGRRRAFHGAMVMIHGVTFSGKPPRPYTEMVQEAYTEFWRKKARLPADWLPLPINSTHFLTAEQALEYGLVDEVITR